ncbi:UNVERIFIED_CONTAM: MinD-like ATPase involved in chromosome partitioning or flagellar assembly [Williamsia faeni]
MTEQHDDWWGSAHIPSNVVDQESDATAGEVIPQPRNDEAVVAPRPVRPLTPVDEDHHRPSATSGAPPLGTEQYVPSSLQTPQSQPLTGTLSTDLLRVRVRPTPESGWRRAVHRATLGAINPGEAPADIEWRITNDRIRQSIRGDYKLAVLSLKGGSGKTTTTAGLGSVFAAVRPDRVIGIDANPDLGTLSSRVRSEHSYTVRDLLADQNITRAADVRIYTNQAPSRFEILASPRDPRIAEAFSEEHYRRTARILEEYYQLILTDCGTGIRHSSMTGVLDEADALVLVTPPALDGAQSAEATLEWLEQNGHADLVARAVTVICTNRPGKSSVDVRELEDHFSRRCRAVLTVPFDPHLAEGQEVLLDRLTPATIKAFRSLAATIADDFPAAAQRRYGRAER